MKLWKMKKSSDFDHEKINLIEKNVGTAAILGRTLGRTLVREVTRTHLLFSTQLNFFKHNT
jgi:hypothetical protein